MNCLVKKMMMMISMKMVCCNDLSQVVGKAKIFVCNKHLDYTIIARAPSTGIILDSKFASN